MPFSRFLKSQRYSSYFVTPVAPIYLSSFHATLNFYFNRKLAECKSISNYICRNYVNFVENCYFYLLITTRISPTSSLLYLYLTLFDSQATFLHLCLKNVTFFNFSLEILANYGKINKNMKKIEVIC
jgi:hypothetical protein